ncbi:MAG: RNA methyltransferase [Bacteroidota bacterium]
MKKLTNEELNRKTIEEFREAKKNPVIVILDNVRSAYNVGSVFRTADAFLIEALLLCGITAHPPHREILKTALGATETVSWKYLESALDAVDGLKKSGYKVYAVEQAEGSINLCEWVTHNQQLTTDNKMALVFGHEVDGVQQKVIDACDGCIEIPQAGMKHSLNISVSVGIVLWHLCYIHFLSYDKI